MRPQTESLRKELLGLEEPLERLQVLKDQYKGETAYILGAGPSLNNYSHDYLREFMSDKLCMPIKQVYNVLKEQADFHIMNFCNFCAYDWTDNKSIVSWIIFEQYHPEMIFNNNFTADLMVPLFRNTPWTGGIDGPNKLSRSVCEMEDWDTMLLDNETYGFNQPWGPGIMYELAIPLAIYLGCSKVVTVGWDIGDLSSFKRDLSDHSQREWQNHFYGKEGRDQVIYAPQKMGPREITSVANSTKSLYYWLKDRGIEWEMVSDRNPGYEGIPRVTL